MQKADHSGHRSRMREKYLSQGLDMFAPHEVLEMLLFYAIPHRNTNELASQLIRRFGSLSAVFEASMDLLLEAGLTEYQATFLKMIPDVTRIYYLDRYDNSQKVVDFDNLGGYIADRFIGIENEEHVLLLLADSKGKEVFCGFISKGTFNASEISIRKIVRTAMNYNAATAIIAHNHPSGSAVPSIEDLEATREIRYALEMIGVKLVDHMIVADHECVSLSESNLLFY